LCPLADRIRNEDPKKDTTRRPRLHPGRRALRRSVSHQLREARLTSLVRLRGEALHMLPLDALLFQPPPRRTRAPSLAIAALSGLRRLELARSALRS